MSYLRPTILYHLLEEGTCTLRDLSRLVGSPRPVIRRKVLSMMELGLLQPATVGEGYSLTKEGIDAALLVPATDVESA